MYWFNLLSLLLGVVAWVYPIVAIGLFKKNKYKKGIGFFYSGLVCALFSLLLVVNYRNHLIAIEDWSALMDTRSTFQFVSIIFVSVTCALNVLAFNSLIKIVKENKYL